MKTGKSPRNKTIELSQEEILYYSGKCQKPSLQSEIDCNNTIFNGDILQSLNNIRNNSIDLLVVDPPYNLRKTFGKTQFKDMSSQSYKNYTQKWIEACLPKLKKTASIYVCSDWRTSILIGEILCSYFIVRNRITWQREKGRGALSNWKNGMEDIWFATMSDDYTFNVDAVKVRRKVIAPYKVDGKPKDWVEDKSGNFRDTHPSNFWDDISIPYWSMPENTPHPTQKPEKLIAKLILASSNKGDLVLDPFLGSGTTAVVAKKLDRTFIGIEREIEYCAIVQKRLEMADADNSIQGYTDGVFWERNTLSEQIKVKNGAINISK